MIWLNVAGAVITTAMGFFGLLFPAKASSLTGLKAVTVAGRAEFRGTLGVTFILLGLTPLLTQEVHACSASITMSGCASTRMSACG